MDKIKDRIVEFVKYKGMTMKSFEISCGLSNGYINSMRKGFGRDKLNNVLSVFPELNREWLLYGEGEMLISGVVQNNKNGSNIHGHTVNCQADNSTEKLIDMLKKKDEQIDRLLTLLENKYKAE